MVVDKHDVNVLSIVPRGGTLSDAEWRSRHGVILVLLAAHLPGLFVFALTRGYSWSHATAEVGVVSAPALVALLAAGRRRRLSTVAASVGLMTASAVLVHLSGGVTEAHFHFFVMVGIVVLYQDWQPYLIAIAFVVVHHAVIGELAPETLYGHASAWNRPLAWAVIHGVAILAMSLAGMVNWKVNERNESEMTGLNAMLESTLESTADGILALDLNGRITAWNGRIRDMYMLPASLLVERDGQAVVASMREQLIDAHQGVTEIDELGAELEAEGHDVLVFKDGRVVEQSSKPQRVSGVVTGRVWTFHEVTKQKRLEDELAAALATAVEASRLKSEFLATMSHEIRTPMNGIIGLTGLLLEMNLGETEREYVEGVHLSGDALLRIVNDILDFSKIEAGMLEIETVEFDPVQAMDEVVALVAQSASVKGLQLSVEQSGDVPKCLRGDVGRLRQVLLNLLSNAVKFTSSGRVTLRCSLGRTTRPSEMGDVRLRFEVQDTGIGIAEADRARLFAPFTQVDASTTRRFGGTGLGLAICSRLTEAMGGTIGVESRLDEGSQFWIDIPFQAGAEESGPSRAQPIVAPQPHHAPPGASLLVVEDNAVNQMVIKQMVRALGYQCDVAANGREALDCLVLRRYSAVIMDCFMPVMDGFDATRELRRREIDYRTPVIALTAGATTEDRARCFAAKMDAFLTKPVNSAELGVVLDELLNVQSVGLVAGAGYFR